jgi:radical SAM protein with 4Fe4S-binding SPASM domain
VSDRPHFTIINQRGRRVLKSLLPLAKPLSLFIEPTNRCNFRCRCCGHGNPSTRDDLKPLVHMEMGLFRKLVSELERWEGDTLKLLRLAVLGEPFMHPQLLEMIRLAKEARIAECVDTFTNGSLLTADVCRKLVEHGLDSIRVSIYSVLPERHRQVTQTRFDVKRIHDNIRRLREIRDSMASSRPFICVKMFDAHGEENRIFLDLYRGIADELDLENVNDATLYNGSDLIGAFYNDSSVESETRRRFRGSLNSHVACPRPFMALVVASNGSVLMCTHDYPRATKIGDATKSTLQEIWNGEELFEFRKMHLLGDKERNLLCRRCEWYKLFPPEDNVDGFPIDRLAPQR